MNDILNSYKRHAEHFNANSETGLSKEHMQEWLDDSTVDYWRHKRFYECLNPIIESEKNLSWLTVGDGRYGNDSKYLLDKGQQCVTTDISEYLLEEARSIGRIKEYSVENAEDLSFEDDTYDYVFCKESYHHFPRPVIALYEMLRVSKKGVVLIEPQDRYSPNSVIKSAFVRLEEFIRKRLNMESIQHSFEVSGNYVYSLSRRELEKVSLGVGLCGVIAYKGVNDAYFPGASQARYETGNKIYKKIKRKIFIKNILSRLMLIDSSHLVSIIFTDRPDDKTITELIKYGYEVVMLPSNPYI